VLADARSQHRYLLDASLDEPSELVHEAAELADPL
jgi:hypothetical protein